ncbi:MAG: hypothetical protein ACI89L_000472 [Phycisphaerales bacterium]|jgi:hypothetical protein
MIPPVSRRDVLRAGLRASPMLLLPLAGCAVSTDRQINRLMESERERRLAASRAAMAAPTGSATSRNGVVKDMEAWSFERTPGRVFETSNFRVFTTLDDSELLDRLPAFLEGSLIRYRTSLGELTKPTDKLVTYAMGTRPQWAALTRRLMGPQAGLYLQIARGGYAANGKGVYFDLGPRDTLAVAAHEGWHQYTQATFAEPLPVWLDEGLATWHEGFRWDRHAGALFLPWSNPQRFDRLRQVVEGDRVTPMTELLDTRPQDLIATSNDQTLDYYAQVWALIHFLVEGDDGAHRAVVETMLQEAATGGVYQRVLDAFGQAVTYRARTRRTGIEPLLVYLDGRDPRAMAQSYDAFVKRLARPGSRSDIVAGRSPMI